MQFFLSLCVRQRRAIMKIKSLWIGCFVVLAFLPTKSKAMEESWLSYVSPSHLKSLISSAFSLDNPKNDEELPDCFIRTNYTPQKYSRDAEVLLTFDLSDENVEKMNRLWYCTQSLITEKNSQLSKQLLSKLKQYLQESSYEPNADLNREQLILDAYCVLANKGFPLALCELSSVFDKGKYGQRVNRKLGYLFGKYGTVGNIEAMRDGQEQCRSLLAELEEEASDDEEDFDTLPTARNSSDESFGDSKTAEGISQKIRKKID